MILNSLTREIKGIRKNFKNKFILEFFSCVCFTLVGKYLL